MQDYNLKIHLEGTLKLNSVISVPLFSPVFATFISFICHFFAVKVDKAL